MVLLKKAGVLAPALLVMILLSEFFSEDSENSEDSEDSDGSEKFLILHS